MNDIPSPSVSEVLTVRSDRDTWCRHCSIAPFDASEFETAINHLLSVHGCRLLHVGQETEARREGIHHRTVAVLGLPDSPESPA